MAGVSIQNLGKSYGAFDALTGIDFEIEDGEFVVLVGPSGCGKSTLLRMIAGLETVTSGHIAIGDRVVNTVPPKERDIAMVFQNYALYPHMTVAENMGFSLRMRGVDKSEVTDAVTRAAAMLGLARLLEHYPRQLSGGQRQRVAMGRAIVRAPQVFLFDEPLSNLDAKLRGEMRTEIRALHERLKTTTVYVTHDQIEAMTMADKIVVMNGGIVEQIGAPLEVYDNPRNLFVASFIGSPGINLLNGRMCAEGFVSDAGLRVDQTVTGACAVEGTAVTLGIRPEHMQLGNTGLPLRVELIEQMGTETFIVGAAESGDRLTCLLRERLSVANGTIIRLNMRPGSGHVFATSGGERIW